MPFKNSVSFWLLTLCKLFTFFIWGRLRRNACVQKNFSKKYFFEYSIIQLGQKGLKMCQKCFYSTIYNKKYIYFALVSSSTKVQSDKDAQYGGQNDHKLTKGKCWSHLQSSVLQVTPYCQQQTTWLKWQERELNWSGVRCTMILSENSSSNAQGTEIKFQTPKRLVLNGLV